MSESEKSADDLTDSEESATEENAEKDSYEFVEPREVAQSFVLATETPTEQPEAFIRLHHLHQGNAA